jgi:hypothetical protein
MELNQILPDGDPIAREPGLDAFHAEAMRQRVLLEARNSEREGFGEREWFTRAFARPWLRPVAVAGALAACLAAGVGIGLRINENESATERSSYVGRPFQGRLAPPRQLQFATPGGTRIIWTFHQEIDL